MVYRCRNKIYLVLIGLLTVTASTVFATEPFATVFTGPVSMASTFPRGARNIGMGGTGVAGLHAYTTGHFNPASFAWVDVVTASGGRNDWQPAFTYTDTRLTAPMHRSREPWRDGWHFGGSLGYADQKHPLQSDRIIFLPEGTTGDLLGGTDYYVSIGGAGAYKRGILEIGIGGAAKYHDAQMGRDYTAWTYDAGVIAATNIELPGGYRVRPRVGVSALNIGSTMVMNIDVPTERRAGIGVDFAGSALPGVSEALNRSVAILSVSADLDYIGGNATRLRNSESGYAFGVEVSFVETVQLRMGRGEDAFISGKHNTIGLGAGWDFGRFLLQFDWARVDREQNSIITESHEDVFGFAVAAKL